MSLDLRLFDALMLDVHLFGGTPETPEPVYERDANSHSASRTTRAMVLDGTTDSSKLTGPKIGRMEIDWDNGVVKLYEDEGP
jgi:hypothetical protein